MKERGLPHQTAAHPPSWIGHSLAGDGTVADGRHQDGLRLKKHCITPR